MSGCLRNDVGSLILDYSSHAGSGGSHRNRSRLWRSLSGSAFRRKIMDTMWCGGGGGAVDDEGNNDQVHALPQKLVQKKLPRIRDKLKSKGGEGERRVTAGDVCCSSTSNRMSAPEKLSDLLNRNLSESSSSSVSTNPNSTSDFNLSIDKCRTEEKSAVTFAVDEEEVKRKEERFRGLSKTVKLLQSEIVEERENSVKLIRRLAKEDSEARSFLVMLGAIPPLVGMLDDCDGGGADGAIPMAKERKTEEALYALLNLGIRNNTNKAAIVRAGAVQNMLKLIESSDGSPHPAVSEAIVANFLALSALDSNKPIIGSSGAIPFLAKTLKDLDRRKFTRPCTSSGGSSSSGQAKQDCLRALYNLSILPSNVPLILETNLIPYLMDALGDMEVSERILSILSNVISVPEGRKAISDAPDAFPVLVDVLSWNDSPGCQEKASYILMVMAHKRYSDRQDMVDAGISTALLELTLLGSTLAQNRASRMLECLRLDKCKHVPENFYAGGTVGASPASAPIYGLSSHASAGDLDKDLKSGVGMELEEEGMMMSIENKAVKQLVQESLQNNMKKIVRRANLPQSFVPSEHLKSLTSSSTSKSLPF